MLPKTRRIPKENFSYILKTGRRFSSPKLLLYVSRIPENTAKNKDKNLTRFSFSVSKKVSPLAVDRNKYRRRGYSVIRSNLNKIKDGYFLFFSFKKGSISVTSQALEKEILALLSEALVLI